MKLTDEEKIKFLDEHFCYEANMLIISYSKLIVLSSKENINENNMALEVFALHSRNLLEFFINEDSKHSDTAKAKHFLTDNTLFSNIENNVLELEKQIRKANKQISHLTYDRLKYTEEDKSWHYDMIFKDFTYIIKMFYECLEDKYKSSNLIDLYKYITTNTNIIL